MYSENERVSGSGWLAAAVYCPCACMDPSMVPVWLCTCTLPLFCTLLQSDREQTQLGGTNQHTVIEILRNQPATTALTHTQPRCNCGSSVTVAVINKVVTAPLEQCV